MHKALTTQAESPADIGVEWRISDPPVPYEEALAAMEERVRTIRAGTDRELVWLLEHPSLYTAGTGAKDEDLLLPGRFPVYRTGRGGQFTYHGPGQRVAYVMLDLRKRGPDIRRYIRSLEEWAILALDRFAVKGERREGRVGIWVDRGRGREDKIAAIGVRIRRWVTFHGIAINVEPELGHFEGIVPCGVTEDRFNVTSLVDLGLPVTMADLDLALAETFGDVFGDP